ncbi:hypothetical protein B14911_11582 [Bacillus sp. NRRL B-14911]|uniref:Uncharacterized protein n=1 Tax=Bacillus infantis NRRL B-14911 TaxID=1367477 RepID=U5LC02_9BACI|nr:hypothetical protein N288_11075 [Bacillus infantis NRRL B-14911]EAR65957.1 hypothetical protein B14911_11582 [Bacillus sp. NRRL B-14911]
MFRRFHEQEPAVQPACRIRLTCFLGDFAAEAPA